MRNLEAQFLVQNSLEHFKSVGATEKKQLVQSVEKHLADHKDALESIGTGYAEKFVIGGKMFLRVISLYRLLD